MNQDEFEAMETGGPGKWWYDTREELLVRELNKLSSNKPNLNILDLASACGGNFPVCSKYGEVFGLDISWSSIQICKSKHIKNLVQADAQVLPFADGSVDVVIALDVLEHLENSSEIFCSGIYPMLKKGGLIILNAPWRGQLTHIDKAADDFYHNGGRKFLSKHFHEIYRLGSNDVSCVYEKIKG